jgi:hypothetical protein
MDVPKDSQWPEHARFGQLGCALGLQHHGQTHAEEGQSIHKKHEYDIDI